MAKRTRVELIKPGSKKAIYEDIIYEDIIRRLINHYKKNRGK